MKNSNQMCIDVFNNFLGLEGSTALKFESTKLNGIKCFILFGNRVQIFSFLYDNNAELLNLWSEMNRNFKISQYPITINDTKWLYDIMEIFPRNEVVTSHNSE